MQPRVQAPRTLQSVGTIHERRRRTQRTSVTMIFVVVVRKQG